MATQKFVKISFIYYSLKLKSNQMFIRDEQIDNSGTSLQWNPLRIKKNDLLIFATMWINLNSMLNERSQTEKNTYNSIYM